MREILGLPHASSSEEEEEEEEPRPSSSFLEEENSMPEFFRLHKRERPAFVAAAVPVVTTKTLAVKKQRRRAAAASSSEDATETAHQQPAFDFVVKFAIAEDARLQGLLRLFLAVPSRRCRPRGEWMRNPPTEPRPDPPNKKYSCQQYTAEFVNWITALAEGVVSLSQGSRTYKLAITDDQKTQIFEDGGVVPVAIPADNRCMGCRRYFVTQDPSKCKELAFHLCKCNKRRASYCIRCRVIQWVLSLPASAGSVEHELPSVGCLACREPWSPSDLFILSVTKLK
jgi:hypothetical protein